MPELRDVLISGDIDEIWTNRLLFEDWVTAAFDGRNLQIGTGGYVDIGEVSITYLDLIAGGVINTGDVVWSDGTNVFQANNFVAGEEDNVIGIALDPAAAAGDDVRVATDGVIDNPAIGPFVQGPIFVGTAGAMVQVAPVAPAAHYLLQIGIAAGLNALTIDFQRPVILVEELP